MPKQNSNEDLIKKYSEIQANDNTNENNPYSDEISRYLTEKNYKDYFNTAVQNYNRSQLLQKNLRANLNASGFGSQGYGATQIANANNDLLRSYAEAQNTFNETQTNIDLDAYDRYTQNQQTRLNELSSFLQNATSEEELNNYLRNYGILNEDGSYNFNGLTESQKANLQSQIDFAKTNLEINGVNNTTLQNLISKDPTPYSSVDDLLNSEVGGNGNGAEKALKDSGIASGIREMFNQIQSGSVSNGTVFYIETNNNGNGSDWGQYFVYYDGAIYRLHESEPSLYNGEKITIKGGGKNSSEEQQQENSNAHKGLGALTGNGNIVYGKISSKLF